MYTFVDQILNGSTSKPISLHDFRLFLLYKDCTIQNLDFYFWYLDYRKRFNDLPEEVKQKSLPPKERPSAESMNLPLDELKKTVTVEDQDENQGEKETPRIQTVELDYITEQDQPYRQEVNSVLRTFFQTDSFKELIISPYVTRHTLYYGCQTTHPDVFLDAFETAYSILKTRCFKNFMHSALKNIRYSVVCFYYLVGIYNFFQIPLLLYMTFSFHAPRMTRINIIPHSFFWAFGFLCGRSGFSTFRGMFNQKMVPVHLISDRVTKKDKVHPTARKKIDLENQLHPPPTSGTDPHVKKYNRVSGFIYQDVHVFTVTFRL
jgi:hypothetical protein